MGRPWSADLIHHPAGVGFTGLLRGQGDDLRHFIGVQFPQTLLKGGIGLHGGFKDGEHLGAGFDLAFPAVDGFDMGAQIDTGRQLRFD